MEENQTQNQQTQVQNNEPSAREKELEAEITKLKACISKANSESAENRRKYQSTLTEQQRLEEERAEKDRLLQEELAGYKTRERIANYKANLINCGYDKDTAQKMAESLPEGIGEDFFIGQKAFIEAKATEIAAKTLNLQPQINAGKTVDGGKAKDIAATNKLRESMGLPPIN